MKATKRPLFGNGEAFAITATTEAAAHTVYTAGAVNQGWDEPFVFVSNTTGGNIIMFWRMGDTGQFTRVSIQGNTHIVQLFPENRDAFVCRGGIAMKVYALGAGLQLHGSVIEVRQDE